MKNISKLFGFFVIALSLVGNLVWAEETGLCHGDVKLDLYYSTLANTTISADITGMKNCEGLAGYISENDCSGQKVCEFEVLTTGDGKCAFPAPKDPKTYIYVVCIDLNSNGVYEENEKDTLVFDLKKGACRSLGCEPSSWSPCLCENGATTGITTGVCIDNCNIKITKQKECECEREVPSENEQNKQKDNLINNYQSNKQGTKVGDSGNQAKDNKTVNLKPSSFMTYYIAGGAILLIVLVLITFLMTGKRPPREIQEKGWKSEEIRISRLE